jgi:hypothetical protein
LSVCLIHLIVAVVVASHRDRLILVWIWFPPHPRISLYTFSLTMLYVCLVNVGQGRDWKRKKCESLDSVCNNIAKIWNIMYYYLECSFVFLMCASRAFFVFIWMLRVCLIAVGV